MFTATLDLDPMTEGDVVHVQDEPALDIALPYVFHQPPLTTLQRGKVANVEALVAQLYRRLQQQPGVPLGREYQELVTEFQPLFTWTLSCWDYLLSIEGCRFLPRQTKPYGIRGDYRVMSDTDFSRLAHRVFRECVLAFAGHPESPCLSQWLREYFWERILAEYRQLQYPPDPRQRTLTAYSYLRCVPYEFLNDVHQELVADALARITPPNRQALEIYFLNFYTELATAQTLGCALEECVDRLRHGLTALLINHRLVYCLLRQIERY